MHPADDYPVISVILWNSSSDGSIYFALVSDNGILKIEALKCFLLKYFNFISKSNEQIFS